MNTLDTQLGWLFVAIAAIFALGLTPRWARHFYPASPEFLRRLAAPVIFVLLAMGCFKGFAVNVLSVVVLLGMTQIIVSRWSGRKQKPIAR